MRRPQEGLSDGRVERVRVVCRRARGVVEAVVAWQTHAVGDGHGVGADLQVGVLNLAVELAELRSRRGALRREGRE